MQFVKGIRTPSLRRMVKPGKRPTIRLKSPHICIGCAAHWHMDRHACLRCPHAEVEYE